MSELMARTTCWPAARRSASRPPSRAPAATASMPVPAETASGTIRARGATVCRIGSWTSMECSPRWASRSRTKGAPEIEHGLGELGVDSTSPSGVCHAPGPQPATPSSQPAPWLVPSSTTVTGASGQAERHAAPSRGRDDPRVDEPRVRHEEPRQRASGGGGATPGSAASRSAAARMPLDQRREPVGLGRVERTGHGRRADRGRDGGGRRDGLRGPQPHGRARRPPPHRPGRDPASGRPQATQVPCGRQAVARRVAAALDDDPSAAGAVRVLQAELGRVADVDVGQARPHGPGRPPAAGS